MKDHQHFKIRGNISFFNMVCLVKFVTYLHLGRKNENIHKLARIAKSSPRSPIRLDGSGVLGVGPVRCTFRWCIFLRMIQNDGRTQNVLFSYFRQWTYFFHSYHLAVSKLIYETKLLMNFVVCKNSLIENQVSIFWQLNFVKFVGQVFFLATKSFLPRKIGFREE